MPIMETIKIFKVSENQKGYDKVELLKTDNNIYIVKWQWTTMRIPLQKEYNSYIIAYRKYQERKHFAITCN